MKLTNTGGLDPLGGLDLGGGLGGEGYTEFEKGQGRGRMLSNIPDLKYVGELAQNTATLLKAVELEYYTYASFMQFRLHTGNTTLVTALLGTVTRIEIRVDDEPQNMKEAMVQVTKHNHIRCHINSVSSITHHQLPAALGRRFFFVFDNRNTDIMIEPTLEVIPYDLAMSIGPIMSRNLIGEVSNQTDHWIGRNGFSTQGSLVAECIRESLALASRRGLGAGLVKATFRLADLRNAIVNPMRLEMRQALQNGMSDVSGGWKATRSELKQRGVIRNYSNHELIAADTELGSVESFFAGNNSIGVDQRPENYVSAISNAYLASSGVSDSVLSATSSSAPQLMVSQLKAADMVKRIEMNSGEKFVPTSKALSVEGQTESTVDIISIAALGGKTLNPDSFRLLDNYVLDDMVLYINDIYGLQATYTHEQYIVSGYTSQAETSLGSLLPFNFVAVFIAKPLNATRTQETVSDDDNRPVQFQWESRDTGILSAIVGFDGTQNGFERPFIKAAAVELGGEKAVGTQQYQEAPEQVRRRIGFNASTGALDDFS
ncbi:hypothetical protein SPFM12_00269 [Salmonella phage SPFM12]|nr:hypothetical protein SPFM12_00269 [Salmonella phage SPFM12]